MRVSRGDKIVYRVARSRKELEEAFSLVYREYTCRGYTPKHYKSKLRLSLYNALPGTTTFIGLIGKRVVSTVTLVPDSELGIPMDKLYKKEVDKIRKKKRRVAEVSQLAVDGKIFPKGWFSMFNFSKLIFIFRLFKLVLDYSVDVLKLDNLCIAVNPRHQYLYKFLGFIEIGKLKYYGTLNRAPAIAKTIDLNTAEERSKSRRGLYKIFFSKKTPASMFAKKFKLKDQDIDYFFSKKSDILAKASSFHRSVIESCYPALKKSK
ncbi:hypothetical protein ACFL0T_07440 [Candidatus Omnitrophota bacterium]